MEQNLKILKNIDGNKVTLFPAGSIDTITSKILGDELQLLDYSDLDLTIDFSQTDYITSAGLRVLLIARKKLTNDTMRVINANDSIIEVFNITGFDSFIKIITNECEEDDDKLSYSALLNRRVNKSKDNVIYIYKEVKYTWGDIDKASSIIAKDLSLQGVKKGSHVGICGTNSINWIFTFFAIQKLGGIAVLINPRLNPTEVLDVCEIGGVTHLCYAEIPGITTYDMYKNICLNRTTIRAMYNISDSIDFSSRFAEFEEIKNDYRETHHADDACVIIFTSGSTGKPKAVLSSAYSISASVTAIVENLRFSSEDVNLAFLPFFHIFGLETNIVIALLRGYCSIIPDGRTPASMIELIEKHRCTVFNTVPTMMLGVVADPIFTPQKLSSLRVSVLGGSATTSEQMSMLMKLLPNAHFANIYGMSENASIAITEYKDTVEHITKTVGKPVKGMEVCIRDADGNKLENGKQGEICIRSDSMLVCYYKLDVSLQPIDDDGWLATGDLGYIDQDGYLRLTGRIKDLIISGGENISPEEIADVVFSLPTVKEVKIIGIPDELKGEVVGAVITLREGFDWDEKSAREEVAKRLAKYKQPVYYIVVDSFPLLGSGKIDTITLKKKVFDILKK